MEKGEHNSDCVMDDEVPLPSPEKRKLKKELIKKDKCIRESQTEDMLDEMVEESFPASDPPSRY